MKTGKGTLPTLRPGQKLPKSGYFSKQSDFAVEGFGNAGKMGGTVLPPKQKQVRAGGGTGGIPRLVAVLPAITSGYQCVTWASSDYEVGGVTGTGDDQVWECDGRVGQTAFTARQFLTSASGTP